MQERFTRSRFIRLGAALGVGAAGASILAACGGEEGTGTVEGAKESGGESVAQVKEGTAIAQESEVEPGSAVEFTDETSGQPAVLVHLESGEFVAYSAVCTHRQCTVSYEDSNLVCPCHGSVFDPANGGAVVNGPAEQPLPEVPVEVQNGEIVRA